MATVDKTWSFAADNESLADAGVSAISVVHDTGGNPGGSLEFTGGVSGTTETARKVSTADTWETWGVPSGGTVTDVTVTTIDSRLWGGLGTRTGTLSVRIVDSSAASVHSAGDIYTRAIGTAADGAWVTAAGTSRAVDAGKQTSTTSVRLEIQLTISAIDSSYDLGVDNLTVRITYTAGGAAEEIPVLVMAPPLAP